MKSNKYPYTGKQYKIKTKKSSIVIAWSMTSIQNIHVYGYKIYNLSQLFLYSKNYEESTLYQHSVTSRISHLKVKNRNEVKKNIENMNATEYQDKLAKTCNKQQAREGKIRNFYSVKVLQQVKNEMKRNQNI